MRGTDSLPPVDSRGLLAEIGAFCKSFSAGGRGFSAEAIVTLDRDGVDSNNTVLVSVVVRKQDGRFCAPEERRAGVLGIRDFWVVLAYVLCIGSTLLCVAYGVLSWNKGVEPVKQEDVQWAKEEKEEIEKTP
jgi:hypothetical protein